MDFESAIAFVKSHGDEIEQARLAYLLANERPSRQIVNVLLSGQRQDGGWLSFWAPDYSSVDATCFRLAQAEQLGLSCAEPAIARAVEFLRQRQHSDGSWQEDEAVAAVAPPWAKPGNLAARLYLTANSGFWLAVLDDSSDGASRAAVHLEAFLDDKGQLPSFPHTHWLAGGLWHRVNRRELAERVLSYLDTQLASLPVSNLAWMIVAQREGSGESLAPDQSRFVFGTRPGSRRTLVERRRPAARRSFDTRSHACVALVRAIEWQAFSVVTF